MKLSFERLQQIILEETIKLLQEKDVDVRAIEKATGVSRGKTIGARSANLQRVMTSPGREAQRAAKDVAGRQAAQAARQAALKTAREGAAKVTQQYGLKGSERLITVKLLQKYPALINSPEQLAQLAKTGTAAITGPTAAANATTALATGGKSALKSAFTSALKGAATAGLRGGAMGGLAGAVVMTAAEILLIQYLEKGARENKERISDNIVRIIHKNARNVTSMERRRLKAFIRGMGDAKEVREEFPQLLDKAKAQLSLANAREAERKRKEQEMYAGAEEFETQAMADQADADYAAQQAQLDDYEQQQAAMEDPLMSVDPLMSTEPGLDPADGVADLRPPAVPADGKKTKRRRVGSLARKARIQKRLNNRLGLTMNKIQAAVGAEETGKYDRETYREILDFQKANLPKFNKKGQKNHDGLVGPVTLAKLKSKFSDWASVGQSRDKKPSTPGISTKLDKTLKVGDKTITSKAEFQKLAQDLYKYRAELKDSMENNKPIQAVQGLRYNINDLADVDRQLKKKYGNRNIVKAYQDLFGFEI